MKWIFDVNWIEILRWQMIIVNLKTVQEPKFHILLQIRNRGKDYDDKHPLSGNDLCARQCMVMVLLSRLMMI